jgi:hypothetical protein
MQRRAQQHTVRKKKPHTPQGTKKPGAGGTCTGLKASS